MSQQIDYQTLVVVSTVSAFIGALVGEIARALIKLIKKAVDHALP